MWSFAMPVLLVIANVLGVGMIVPQVHRFHRHRVTDGVSPVWLGVGVAMNAWWLAYALAGGLWGLVPVSASALVLYGVMAVQYAGLDGRASLRPIGLTALAVAAAPAALLAGGGWGAAGLAVGLAYAVQFSPAAVSALRSPDLSGISVATWAMAFAEAAIWFAYGWVEGSPALVVGGLGGGLMSAVVVACVLRRGAGSRVTLGLAVD